jgi:curli production assembly/transport component CsgG|tara:strand:- start:5813 stop:6733 length:921 start_codon:yes stop_codon:yes gene_type:complete
MRLYNVLVVAIVSMLFSGCASMSLPQNALTGEWCYDSVMECIEEPKEVELPTYAKLRLLPPAEIMPVVAVYNFTDLTGQRKQKDNVALFSTAVTQGAKALLIDALKAAGAGETSNGTWFRVVERGVGLDNLVRERQIIRSTRDEYIKAGKTDTAKLQPMLFAGILLEGGIVGYDSNIETGGNGARYLGIGASSQYRRDSIVVSLRAVSVLTGEIILNVQTYKTILSVAMGGDVFRFLDMDTKLLELETGITSNESVTWAVRSATEAAVLALIEQGDSRGYWRIDYDNGVITDAEVDDSIIGEINVE